MRKFWEIAFLISLFVKNGRMGICGGDIERAFDKILSKFVQRVYLYTICGIKTHKRKSWTIEWGA